MHIHYCAVRLSSSSHWYVANTTFLYLTFILRNSNKIAVFLFTYWCNTFW